MKQPRGPFCHYTFESISGIKTTLRIRKRRLNYGKILKSDGAVWIEHLPGFSRETIQLCKDVQLFIILH